MSIGDKYLKVDHDLVMSNEKINALVEFDGEKYRMI